MNSIERLIAELCPDGVEHIALSSLVSQVQQINWREHMEKSFKYVDLSSVNSVTGNVENLTTVTAHDAPSRARQIIASGDTLFGATRPLLRRVMFVDSSLDSQICSTGYCVLRPITNLIQPRFLFHLIRSGGFFEHVKKFQEGASYPSISQKNVLKYVVPVPPLVVQQRIVGVLDVFSKLEAELEAELEARRAQYAFYRDRLLSFSESGQVSSLSLSLSLSLSRSLNLPSFEVAWLPMGDVGVFIRGQGVQKSDFVDEGVGAIHYGQIHTHFGISTDRTVVKVPVDVARRLRHVEYGDLLIATTSENDAGVGKATAWLGHDKCVMGGDAHIYRHRLDPRYVSHFFASEMFQLQKRKKITGEKVRRISGKSLSQLLIPVPPVVVQQRIADVLDGFDSLVNDLFSGLPAEIAARRRQYEYYRDHLLSFPAKQ